MHWVSEKVHREPENKAARDCCIHLLVTPSGLFVLCMHLTLVGRVKDEQPFESRTLVVLAWFQLLVTAYPKTHLGWLGWKTCLANLTTSPGSAPSFLSRV